MKTRNVVLRQNRILENFYKHVTNKFLQLYQSF